MSAAPPRFVFARYQAALRTTPTVEKPSPFQSPVIGKSPGSPNPRTLSAMPVVGVLRRYHTPLRKTPGASPLDAADQRPTTGMSPGSPNANSMSARGGPWVFSRYQKPLRKTP